MQPISMHPPAKKKQNNNKNAAWRGRSRKKKEVEKAGKHKVKLRSDWGSGGNKGKGMMRRHWIG